MCPTNFKKLKQTASIDNVRIIDIWHWYLLFYRTYQPKTAIYFQIFCLCRCRTRILSYIVIMVWSPASLLSYICMSGSALVIISLSHQWVVSALSWGELSGQCSVSCVLDDQGMSTSASAYCTPCHPSCCLAHQSFFLGPSDLIFSFHNGLRDNQMNPS